MGFLGRMREGLSRTTQQIVERFDDIVRRADAPERRSRAIDVETVEALEELLISADIGVAATDRIIAAVKAQSRNGASLRDLVKQEIRAVFAAVDTPIAVDRRPQVTLIVGVNGTGKTTTVGKLANLLKSQGQNAADLRGRHVSRRRRRAARDLGARAPASTWCGRAKAPIRPRSSSTRSRRARRRAAIRSSIDTAGRLHTRVNLMNELEKIRRIASREVPGAPQEVLLVLDATVGQNGVAQAREFMGVAGVNGIVLTKLDGTAKGGVAVAIAHDLKLPIRYVGVGEGIDDLVPFSADEYVDGLFEEKW